MKIALIILSMCSPFAAMADSLGHTKAIQIVSHCAGVDYGQYLDRSPESLGVDVWDFKQCIVGNVRSLNYAPKDWGMADIYSSLNDPNAKGILRLAGKPALLINYVDQIQNAEYQQ